MVTDCNTTYKYECYVKTMVKTSIFIRGTETSRHRELITLVFLFRTKYLYRQILLSTHYYTANMKTGI